MNCIFHAFNLSYGTIQSLAPHLSDLGFTHIQFPPIQTTRVLTEHDYELLQSMVKLKDVHLSEYHKLCTIAREKNERYSSHTYDYLLRQRLHYIRQPTFKHLHSLLLDGGAVPDTLLDTLSHSDGPDSLRTLTSAFLTGKTHPLYPLIEAAEIVLTIKPIPEHFDDSASHIEYAAIQQKIKHMNRPIPNAILKKCSELNKRTKKDALKNQQRAIHARLRELVPLTSELRRTFLSDTHGSIDYAAIKKPKHWLDVMFVCEFLLYPPWWMIYQPLELAIGDTMLGTRQDSLDAIKACKAYGLTVLSDVVVNNLAAVAGEKQFWSPYATQAKAIGAKTLAEVTEDAGTHVRDLLLHAFQSSDLSLLTAPYECRAEQDPTLCWMSGCLPQLNPDHPRVRQAQGALFQSLRDAGVDGIRVDAAAHLTSAHCRWMLNFFEDDKGSYIEYVGPNGDAYDLVRKEDFAIGEDLYLHIFSEQAQFQKIKNYGGNRIDRLDSVVMIVNHDHVMGSLPSDVFNQLPSRKTYELSLAYLLQRVYGNVLLMPHDIEFEYTIQALQFRRLMKEHDIVREYVSILDNVVQILKYNANDDCRFVVFFNMNSDAIETSYGILDPLSFQWFNVSNTSNVKTVYNSRHRRWMTRYCLGQRNCGKQSKTRKRLKLVQPTLTDEHLP